MNSTTTRLVTALTLALALLCGLLLVMGAMHPTTVALAQGTVRYVASTGNDSGNDCTNSNTPCAAVQYAVDVSDPGDEIRVATGVYTGVQARPRNDTQTTGLVTQVVYISQTLAIRGGYTATNWTVSDPVAYPTTLDAQNQGRVFYITGNISPTIESLHIISGTALGLGGSSVDAGGAVYVITATTIFSNNELLGPFKWWVTLGANLGGGIFILNANGVQISNNTISGHLARQGGGLFLSNSPNAMVVANAITTNYAIGPYGQGGGLYFGSSPGATLISNTISGNKAAGGGINPGGGLSCNSSDNMTLMGNIIQSNSSDIAGGGLFLSQCNDIKLTANLVGNNLGGCCGGGLRIENSTNIELTDNLFSNNSASREGGGGSIGGSNNVILSSNTALSNVASNGAGLHLFDNTNMHLTNNIIADNQIPLGGIGSGLYMQNTTSNLLHNTIARNSGGDNSGLHITGTNSTVAMTNTILVSHTVGLTVTAGNTATLNGVLWYDNLTNTAGDGMITITNAYTGDPLFRDQSAGDYHLSPGSAALDRGLNAGVTEDIDGDPRPIGAGYDLGADEFPAALIITKQAAPDPVLAGSLLHYTIYLTNTGNVILTAILTDILPASVTPTGVITWPLAAITPDEVWTQSITVTVAEDYSGPLTNTVKVTTAEGASGNFTETSMVLPVPALIVVKEAYPNPVQVGEPLTYTIRITNTGDMTLTATITDILPPNVTLSGPLVWSPTDIAPDEVWTQQVVVTVGVGSCWLTNVVKVSTAEGETGSYTATTRVLGCRYLPVVLK